MIPTLTAYLSLLSSSSRSLYVLSSVSMLFVVADTEPQFIVRFIVNVKILLQNTLSNELSMPNGEEGKQFLDILRVYSREHQWPCEIAGVNTEQLAKLHNTLWWH